MGRSAGPQPGGLRSIPVLPSPASTAVTHRLSPGLSRGGGILLPGSSTAHIEPFTPEPSTSCFPGPLDKIPSPHSGPRDGETCLLLRLPSCLNPFAAASPGCFTSPNMPPSFLSAHLLFPPLDPQIFECLASSHPSGLRSEVTSFVTLSPKSSDSPLLSWVTLFHLCHSELSSHSWCSHGQAAGERLSVCLI